MRHLTERASLKTLMACHLLQDKLDPFALVADELAMLGHKLRSMVAAEVRSH